MKVLVIGSGGREYGMVWAARQSKEVEEVIAAPGNAGIARLARCVPIKAEDSDGLIKFCQQESIDLVLIGPEGPLADGLVDKMSEAGLPAFGPSRLAAQLEGSKIFAKKFMQRHQIPTAAYEVVTDSKTAMACLDKFSIPVVIKADGLAAGKGVIVAMTREEAEGAIKRILDDKQFGQAGNALVIEEFMQGEEASILAFADGTIVVPMVSAQDHKRIFDGDQGPNTGGMGAYSPAPVITEDMVKEIKAKILDPVIKGMAEEGTPYKGILYAGLMMTEQGPKVVEFNCRFGDPETQVVLPLLTCDLIKLAQACIQGTLTPEMVTWKESAAVTVVLAAPGYPGDYPKGAVITGIEEAEKLDQVMVWHAGTKEKDHQIVTNGGRVLNVIALGSDIGEAIKKVYQACEKIRFDGVQYRKDIGYRALERLAV